MFIKIFFHAFKRPLKVVLTLLVASLIAGTISGIFYKIRATTEKDILFSIGDAVHTLFRYAITVLAFVSFWSVMSSFSKAVTTDEAYFTFTLPAKTKTQTLARYLSILLWLLIIAVVTTISFAIIDVFKNGIEYLKPLPPNETTADQRLLNVEFTVIGCFIVFAFISHAMFGVVFANWLSFKLRKKLSSFIVGVMFFLEMVALLVLLVFLVVLHYNKTTTFDTPHYITWIFMAILAGLFALTYYLTYKFMGRWLNLA